jgi:hypothetical protein
MKRNAGLTFLEVTIAVGLAAVMIPTAVRIFNGSVRYFGENGMRQQLTGQASVCMTTIRQFLRLGQASSVVIDSVGSLPYSRISFVRASDSMPFQIYTSAQTAYMKSGTREPVPLATNVRSLIFIHPDSADPTLIGITLRLGSRMGSTTINTSQTNQLVQMLQN